jgi:hypothetical protein
MILATAATHAPPSAAEGGSGTSAAAADAAASHEWLQGLDLAADPDLAEALRVSIEEERERAERLEEGDM